MSEVKVNKISPRSGTDVTLGDSSDTFTVPSGVGLTLTDSTLLLPTTITSTTEVKTNKISPATGTAFTLGDSGDTFTLPSGATMVNSGTATGFGQSLRPNVNPLIINGDMAVSQRTTSTSAVATNGYHACDRWRWAELSTAVVTISQDTDVPTGEGFATSLKVDVTTADASLGAADNIMVQQKMEGQNLQLLKKGTSSAESLTLNFWVKSTKTGTYIATLYDRDNNRIISKSYTVSVSDTWEEKLVTFAGDTTGALGNDNGASLDVWWWLGGGTDYTSGSLATSWETYTAANIAPGQVNFTDNTSNNFLLTGAQLEVGEFTTSTIPSFQHESFANNLQRCQRYYCTSVPYGTAPTNGLGACCTGFSSSYYSGGFYMDPVFFPVNMRTAPTASIVTSNNGNSAGMKMSWYRDGGAGAGCGWSYMTAAASGTWTDNTFSWNGSGMSCGSFSQDETIVTQFNYIMDAEL